MPSNTFVASKAQEKCMMRELKGQMGDSGLI